MPLVGRERESATLRGLFDRAAAGQGSLVLVSGEPGIGKRSLVAQLVAYARTGGAAVLTGRAVADSGPYRAVSDALLPVVRSGQVRETPDLRPFRGALSRILPGWGAPEPPETGLDRLTATRLRLGRLTDTQTGALVDGLRRVPASVRELIVQRAEGLPLVA